MKDKRMHSSWDKVVPSEVSEKRMLASILMKTQSESRKVTNMKKRAIWKIAAPIAACLVVVVVLTITLNNGGLSGDRPPEGKADGYSIVFNNVEGGGANTSADFPAINRPLTADEVDAVFPKLTDTHTVNAYANFLESDKSFLYATAEVGFKDDIATKVEVWSGNRATDAVIEGMTTKSDVYGTEVTAGYFITDKNSQGISNSVWFASFKLNGFSYYVELGGVESNSDAMKAEVTDLIGKLIKGGAPDLSKVKA